MRTFARCLVMLLLGAGLVATTAGWVEAQGILSTKHNLSPVFGTGGTVTRSVFATTQTDTAGNANTEVCVYCHTPHGADTTVSAPLWNRAVNSTGYTMYNSPTLDATMDSQPTGVSVACLSCHDGTIAFDALRNLPGSGGYSSSPSATGTSNWTFNGATNKMMPPTGITNIGQDLSNDHPISMLYSSAKSPSSASSTNDHATGFNDPTADVFTNGVRLYSGKVQCASCHDPHMAANPTFLRVSNAGSALCLTCHRKNV